MTTANVTEVLTFIDPDGVETVVPTTRGLSGRLMPPVGTTEAALPSADGSRLRAVRFGSRQVVVPIWLESPDLGAHRQLLRDWARRLNPRRGDSRLRVAIGASTFTYGDEGLVVGGPSSAPSTAGTFTATVRELTVRYVGGFGLDESYPHFTEASLLFTAPDPWWYDAEPQVVQFAIAATPPPFFPIPNADSGSFLTLAASTISLAQDVTNYGDAEAWPVWTVYGPADNVRIQNTTTGQALFFDEALASDEVLVIDTRPGVKSVTKDGVNRFDGLTQDSVLWAIGTGGAAVNVQMPGATVQSSARLSYALRWLSP